LTFDSVIAKTKKGAVFLRYKEKSAQYYV